MNKSIEANTDFYHALQIWRNTPNKINISPAERFLCRKTRCPIPTINLKQRVYKNVQKKIEKQRNNAKQHYNRNAKDQQQLKNGQKAYIKITPDNKKWEPGYIRKQIKDRSYIININGRNYRRNIYILN